MITFHAFSRFLDTSRWKTLFTKSGQHLPAISMHLLLEVVVACGLILAIAVPRLLALDSFVTTDERLWLERSGKFYYALAQHDFAATFQKSHPGVTVMWAGLTGYMEVYPSYDENQGGQNRPIGLSTLQKRQFDLPLQILAAGRRTMVLLNVLVLGLSFLFARRLFGMLPALVGFLLIAFDPFHIALSRVLHLDGLLGNFMLLSLLAFLVYLEERRIAALVVSAVAAGLAWLTKSPGLFIVPLIFLLALFDLVRLKNTRVELGWWKSAFHYVKVLTAWGIIAMLVFCLLWPAMWVNPRGTLTRVLNDAIGYAQEGHESAVFYNGTIYANGEIHDPSFYPINFLWRTTPVTLLGLLATFMLLIQRILGFGRNLGSSLPTDNGSSASPLSDNVRQRWAVLALLLLALGFGALMTLGLKKFDRYIVPSIVALDLVAGVGLVWLVGWIRQYLRDKWRTVLGVTILLGLIAFQAVLAWNTYPYFFSYYNPLLGGSRQAIKVMQIGWGEGLDQAARYINKQPNSEDLRVIAWYAGGSFSYFSKSRVRPMVYGQPWSASDWNLFNKANYVVVYIHQWQRNLPPELLDPLRDSTPEYSVWINGLEYVRVYKIQ